MRTQNLLNDGGLPLRPKRGSAETCVILLHRKRFTRANVTAASRPVAGPRGKAAHTPDGRYADTSQLRRGAEASARRAQAADSTRVCVRSG